MQNQIWKLKCTYTLEIGLFIYTISKSKYITGIVWYTNHSHALSVYMEELSTDLQEECINNEYHLKSWWLEDKELCLAVNPMHRILQTKLQELHLTASTSHIMT